MVMVMPVRIGVHAVFESKWGGKHVLLLISRRHDARQLS